MSWGGWGHLVPQPCWDGEGCGAAASSQLGPASPPPARDNLITAWPFSPETDPPWLLGLSLLHENPIQTFHLLVR